MNKELIQLLGITSNLDSETWLVFPPNKDPEKLTIRVESYQDVKHSFERDFTLKELQLSKDNLLDRFIDTAIRSIQERL